MVSLDLRHVNIYVKQNKFCYENFNMLSEILTKDDHFTTFYLTSGYHQIKIHTEHHKFIGFEWTLEDGSGRYFQFFVLSFGLSFACYIFTNALCPSTKRWPRMGIKEIIYIDDSVAEFRNFDHAQITGQTVMIDLISAGFVFNNEESEFFPKTKGKWLVAIIDTVNLLLSVLYEKSYKLLEDTILTQNYVTPKQQANIAGQLSSMHIWL